MATDIQVLRSGEWESIDFGTWQIENGVSDLLVAPKANIRTHADEDVNANQDLRIQIDETTRFQGRTTSSGRQEFGGGRRLKVEHSAYDLFEDSVDIDLTTPTPEDVLNEALSEASLGGDFSIDYAGTPSSLDDDYVCEDRSVKSVFRDMTDRTHRVWWVDSATDVIHFEPYEDRGEWDSISFPPDDGGVIQFDEGEVSTVRNDVSVNGTRGERVNGQAAHAGSQVEFGRRFESFNFDYITSISEAVAMANELLIPDPLASAEIVLGETVGDTPEQNLSNHTITVSDDSKGLDELELVIESQTIEQGKITLRVGEGAGVSMENVNRNAKSRGDNSRPGTEQPPAPPEPDSIATEHIQDLAVELEKIQDLAISQAKIQSDAITSTKIEDDAITTPKINAGAVDAGTIDANAITATHITSGGIEADVILADEIATRHIATEAVTANEIEGGTITANEIDTDTITADQIDTLQLEVGEIQIGNASSSGYAFSSQSGVANMTPVGLDSNIGLQDPFGIIAGNTLVTQGIQAADDEVGFSSDIRFRTGGPEGDPAAVLTTTGGSITFRPVDDDTERIGAPAVQWADMYAGNFVESSPEPLESANVDLDEFCGCDWYDPPDYIKRGTPGRPECPETDPDEDVPEDYTGVELGAASNYLFEVSKAQQEIIDELEESVGDLRAEVRRLKEEKA